MFKNLSGIRLGFFVFAGLLLMFLSIFLVGNKDSLFVKTITLKTYFSSVEGLRAGASVRLSGMDVGSVSDISIKGDTSGQVEVTFKVNEDISNFIRLDSQASIETEGLVGAKILSVTPGSQNFDLVKDGGVIKAKNPINMSAIFEETTNIVGHTKNLTKEFAEIFAKVNQGSGTIGKLINDKTLYESTVKLTKSADKSLTQITDKLTEITNLAGSIETGFAKVMSNLDTSIASVKNLITRVESGEGTIGKLLSSSAPIDSVQIVINNLVKTTKAAQEGTQSFAENMEALKHNWLFKGYFEKLGYWNKVDYEKDIDKKVAELTKLNKEYQERIDKLEELSKKINKDDTK